MLVLLSVQPRGASSQVHIVWPAAGEPWDAEHGRLCVHTNSTAAGGTLRLEIVDSGTGVAVSMLLPTTAEGLDTDASVLALGAGFAVHGLGAGGLGVQALGDSVVEEPFSASVVRIRASYTDALTGHAYTTDVGGVRMFRSLATNATACTGRGSSWMGRCSCVTGAFGPVCEFTSAEACGAVYCAGAACDRTVLGVMRCAAHNTTSCMCANNGTCVGELRGLDSRCDCDEGWFGPRCEFNAHQCSIVHCGGSHLCTSPAAGMFECASCRDHCSGRGDCVEGRCACDAGWRGARCEAVASCVGNCSPPRVCAPLDCTCNFGTSCNVTAAQCNNLMCSDRGACVHQESPLFPGESKCVCRAPRFGTKCEFFDRDHCSSRECMPGYECVVDDDGRYITCERRRDRWFLVKILVSLAAATLVVLAVTAALCFFHPRGHVRRNDEYNDHRQEAQPYRPMTMRVFFFYDRRAGEVE